MPGAAILSAEAALRSGAGIVRVATIPDSFTPIQINVPEAICVELEEGLNRINSFDAVAIGPGFGKGMLQSRTLEKVLLKYNGKLIIDADALNLISESDELADRVRGSKSDIVMTPHIGEAERLLHIQNQGKVIYTEESRVDICKRISEEYGVTVLLKGEGTLVADKSKQLTINTTGNPGMATAGSGDVLTGIIVSLMGQGLDVPIASRVGAYLHGLAGDISAEEFTEYSMTSGDIAEFLPDAFKEILE